MAPGTARPTPSNRPIIVNNQTNTDPTVKKIVITSGSADPKPEFISPIFSAEASETFKPQPTTPPAQPPKFGSLQSKIDAHPLFSGAKEPAPKKQRKLLATTGWLSAVLLVIAAGAYVLIDSGVVNTNLNLPIHIFRQTESTTQSVIGSASATQTTTYNNPDLGFTFSYPKEWGDVVDSISSASQPASILYQGTFSKNKLVEFALATKGYSRSAVLAANNCAELGFGGYAAPEQINNFSTKTTELLGTADRSLVEIFKNGDCGGNKLQARVKLPLVSSNGIEFVYYDQKSVINNGANAASVEDYMKTADGKINQTIVDQFLGLVTSVKSL